MNTVNLMGNIGKDIELKTTPSGKSVCSFSLAVRRTKDVTDWINVVAWEKTAEMIANNFSKGSKIAITGSIQTRNYEDKQGNKRTAVDVVADRVFFTESKGHSAEVEKPATIGGFEVQDDDSDLPF